MLTTFVSCTPHPPLSGWTLSMNGKADAKGLPGSFRAQVHLHMRVPVDYHIPECRMPNLKSHLKSRIVEPWYLRNFTRGIFECAQPSADAG